MGALKLSPAALAEMTKLIEDGTISGKIGKQILPQLLQVPHLIWLLHLEAQGTVHSRACGGLTLLPGLFSWVLYLEC